MYKEDYDHFLKYKSCHRIVDFVVSLYRDYDHYFKVEFFRDVIFRLI